MRSEARLAVWGQSWRVGGCADAGLRIGRGQGASILKKFQAGSGAPAGTSPAVGAAWAGSAGRSGGVGVGGEVALVVGADGAGGLRPEDRFARGGVGLGLVVGKQLSSPRRVRGIDGCARPCAASLIEVVSRVDDGGAGGGGFCIELFRESGCRFLSMDGGSDPLIARSIVVKKWLHDSSAVCGLVPSLRCRSKGE